MQSSPFGTIGTNASPNWQNLASNLFTPVWAVIIMDVMNRDHSLPATLQQLAPSLVPWLLATGLGLVTAAQFVTHVPVMVGVAVLMLGSTLAIRDRVPPQLRLLVMTVNLVGYLLLYALFLGAVMHQATLWVPIAPPWFRLMDLGSSIWLVILSLQVGVRQIQAAL
jgi:hypothetical protein